MNIEELKRLINKHNDIPETNKNWDGRIMSYKNDYIEVIRLDDSNKHNAIDYTKLDRCGALFIVQNNLFHIYLTLSHFKKSIWLTFHLCQEA